MRMGCFMFSGVFWGVLLILIGICVIIKVLFNVSIPIFRIGFALLFIYVGIRILTGGFWKHGMCCGGSNTSTFRETNVSYSENMKEYNVVFGKGVINLVDIKIADADVNLKSSTVFGESVIKVNKNAPVMIIVTSAFGAAKMPDGTIISFGNYTYKSKAYKEGEKYLRVEANVVFGNLAITEE